MISDFFEKYTNRFVSGWLIFLFDLSLIFGLYFIAFLIRFNFDVEASKVNFYLLQLPYIIIVFSVGFFIFKPYQGVIRHTTVSDIVRIFLSLTFSAAFFIVITYITQKINPSYWSNIPFSIILIHFLLGAFVLVNTRFVIKALYYQLVSPSKRTNVLIYGVGGLGVITKNSLEHSTGNNYKIIGFIDDHPSKQGKKVDGVKVFSPGDALNEDFIYKEQIQEVVLAIHDISAKRKRDIVNTCLNLDLKVRFVSSVENWLEDSASPAKIKDVRIEDLLGRDCIQLDTVNIEKGIKDNTILVTGAAGSIGSEIVRQVLKYSPSFLVLLDQAETPLNDVLLENSESFSEGRIKAIVCDITNKQRLETVFKQYRPDLIFHAAAYKHVPIMEDNPYEAVSVNVGGTKNVADLSVKFGVKKVIMISTDKAVNPTNIMGTTKRVAEKYCRSVGKFSKETDFVITRFGNVLGSNGSVIPLFRKQIEKGGPLTVTHKDITRYFMTIPEACQLVLEAAFMGKEGEIFVFDMGESVKIYDLARKMIKLSGLRLGKDIDIKITGLRSGEKLYEELLANKENTIPTHHPKIMIGKVAKYNYSELLEQVERLISGLSKMNSKEIYKKLIEVVPEFTSTNPVYEEK